MRWDGMGFGRAEAGKLKGVSATRSSDLNGDGWRGLRNRAFRLSTGKRGGAWPCHAMPARRAGVWADGLAFISAGTNHENGDLYGGGRGRGRGLGGTYRWGFRKRESAITHATQSGVGRQPTAQTRRGRVARGARAFTTCPSSKKTKNGSSPLHVHPETTPRRSGVGRLGLEVEHFGSISHITG